MLRRTFLARGLQLAALGGLSARLPLPAWATADAGGAAEDAWDLAIGPAPITLGDRRATAAGINGTVPGPLIRLREGRDVVLNVSNRLDDPSSIHWHGLLLPFDMDGVPGISFDGIAPGETFTYRFRVRQHGTYWYHSHSGLQEQAGVYGPLVIDPAGADRVAADREFVILLSDWTFENPHRVLANLKFEDDYYNRNRVAGQRPFDEWARMRMSKSDIADVSAATYTYLLNGRDAAANWTGLFAAGERVRLRFINGSAMSFFNVRIPGLTMTVVQADGQDVEPVAVEEFQIGTAETYDVIVTPAAGAWTIMCESADRSGYVRGTLASQPGLTAAVPPLREPPLLNMADMGMDHGAMGGSAGNEAHTSMEHSAMDHSATDHAAIDHGATDDSAAMDHSAAGHAGHGQAAPADPLADLPPVDHRHRRGPGVDGVADMPASRLHEPGAGLADVPHRALAYTDLRSLVPGRDERAPGRVIELHLTGNMHRYMWSFDGLKFSEVTGPIELGWNERVRLLFVNDTMMAHPIHLHGMFVELVNGNGPYNPRKHTVVVKPAERLAVDLTADEPGPWAFHCHLLYHMQAGMMRVVRVAGPA
ncbi:MAG TPA: copper resistance system multicopper oxidase [Woeseiaceae bacterium]|nr:copper resistance system multicopper oxidase [Woeseiaceae bacterium]